MFKLNTEILEPSRLTRHSFESKGKILTHSEVLSLIEDDGAFRSEFNRALASSFFTGFRWETPIWTTDSLDRPFEYVLINAPEFVSRPVDSESYNDYFTLGGETCGIVSFPNLGGDARLIVPTRWTDCQAYGHLAAFVRQAPEQQQDALWQTVGIELRQAICEQPVWLSTAGGGVAWLHVRIDQRPKYYGYGPYRQ